MNHYNTQCIYFRTIVSYSHNILINEIQEYAVNFWEINPETICSLNVTTRCEYRFWQFVIKHMFLANFCLVMHPIGLKSCQEIHWEMQSDIELEFSKSYNLQLVWFFPLHARQVARQGVWSALNFFPPRWLVHWGMIYGLSQRTLTAHKKKKSLYRYRQEFVTKNLVKLGLRGSFGTRKIIS